MDSAALRAISPTEEKQQQEDISTEVREESENLERSEAQEETEEKSIDVGFSSTVAEDQSYILMDIEANTTFVNIAWRGWQLSSSISFLCFFLFPI